MATKATELVEIKPIEQKKVKLRIVGDSPLIFHNWDEKAKRMMLEAQQGKKKGKEKAKKNPVADFINSLYWLSHKPTITDDMTEEECERAYLEAIEAGATFGFTAGAIKQASISSAYRNGWSKDKMSIRGAFFIEGDENNMIQICGDAPVMREDMVRVGMGSADLRYRGMMTNWYADLTIIYNVNGNYSLENIINMINAGGYNCGIGDWRPERDGTYGMYHVQTD